MSEDYKVISILTSEQEEDLAEFLGSRLDTEVLMDLIENNLEPVDCIYRGIKYRKKDLVKGSTYQHGYPLSSWTTNEEMAIKFALNDYIPEGAIEDVGIEKGYNVNSLPHDSKVWDELYGEFINIVLECKNTKGFVVNNHLVHDYFKHEEEVIYFNGVWTITDIEKCYSDKYQGEYYKVQVEVFIQ